MGPQREIASRWREYIGNVSASETKGKVVELKHWLPPDLGSEAVGRRHLGCQDVSFLATSVLLVPHGRAWAKC